MDNIAETATLSDDEIVVESKVDDPPVEGGHRAHEDVWEDDEERDYYYFPLDEDLDAAARDIEESLLLQQEEIENKVIIMKKVGSNDDLGTKYHAAAADVVALNNHFDAGSAIAARCRSRRSWRQSVQSLTRAAGSSASCAPALRSSRRFSRTSGCRATSSRSTGTP